MEDARLRNDAGAPGVRPAGLSDRGDPAGELIRMARPIKNVPLALTEIAIESISFAYERRNAFCSRSS